jgi:hypothetical protein
MANLSDFQRSQIGLAKLPRFHVSRVARPPSLWHTRALPYSLVPTHLDILVAMEKERAKQKGLSYCQKLLPSARDRYLRKLFDINDVDPYEVPAKQWCADFASLPPVSHGDLLNYLVFLCQPIHLARIQGIQDA